MAPYVLIRETSKGRKAPLLACVSVVAGLGVAGALFGGAAYGYPLAAGLLRLFVLPAPSSGAGHGTPDFEDAIQIKADSSGHYYVEGSADGVPLVFLIDSGATNIVIPKSAARAMNVGPLHFDLTTATANGRIKSAPITIHNLTIGSFTVSDIPAEVNGGELDQPLLGMRWLGLFRDIEIKNGIMTLSY